jgi:hypothetical protein
VHGGDEQARRHAEALDEPAAEREHEQAESEDGEEETTLHVPETRNRAPIHRRP